MITKKDLKLKPGYVWRLAEGDPDRPWLVKKGTKRADVVQKSLASIYDSQVYLYLAAEGASNFTMVRADSLAGVALAYHTRPDAFCPFELPGC